MEKRAVSQDLIMLGERIRNRRMEMCLSQEALAEKAGISTNTVSRIEGGQTAMSIEIFMKLVQILGADADELLGIIPAEENKECRDGLYRISHLRKHEQEIVMQTMEALIDGLSRNR